ncbi:Beta-catenin-like protein 1, partial [Characodon lateralis]|nr:Beta-catenin-like protein 1 [Characodon lateralis]
IIENMAEFRPGLCTEAAQQGLMQWLLKRIKAKMPFDANKLYCSEILAILLQNNDTTRELLGEMDGIDVLLQQLSVFKRHNPNTAEEQEMMENLFDALCSCLMLSSNRDRFLKGEGLQLMNLMLREKKMSRTSALKVLDHAMIGPEGADNCHKFVDVLGLRTIFPLFMKTPKKMKKTGSSEKEHEVMIQYTPSIIPSIQPLSSVYPWVGLRGQQPKQRDPDFPLPSHLGQLVQGNPKEFQGQPRNIVPPACPGSSSGPPPTGTCPEHLTGEASRRHPNQMPEPSQLASLDVEKQRLHSESLPDDQSLRIDLTSEA